jgi:intracellular sulfur oxidation DsrE/DsrF family protein
MKSFFLALVLLAATSVIVPPAGAVQWDYPVIQGYGPVHPLPDARMQPDRSLTYKIVFDIASDKADSSGVNSQLAHVARLVNVFASAGVMPQRMKLAAVVHAAATPLALSDKGYRSRTGKPNPNHKLIEELTANAVEIYVCGQSLADFGIDRTSVDPHIQIALSAQVAIPTFELLGYAYMP